MHKSATQETPFALTFGTEAVGPAKIGLKSLRIELASVEHNEEALRLNLDLLDEKRDQVLKRTEDYQRKTIRYYDRKVKPRSYKPSDLVLKKLLPARKYPTHGKLRTQLGGPVTRGQTWQLRTPDERRKNSTTLSTSNDSINRPRIVIFNIVSSAFQITVCVFVVYSV